MVIISDTDLVNHRLSSRPNHVRNNVVHILNMYLLGRVLVCRLLSLLLAAYLTMHRSHPGLALLICLLQQHFNRSMAD